MIGKLSKVFLILNKNQKRDFGFLCFLVFILAALDLFSIGAFIPVLMALVENDYENNFFFSFLFKQFSFINDDNLILYLVVSLLFIFLIKSFLSILVNKLKYKILFKIMGELTKNLAEIFLKIPYIRFIKLKPHKTIELITREIEYFILGVIDPLTIIILEFIILIMIFSFLVFYDFYSSIFIFGVSILILGFFSIFFSKRMKTLGKNKLNASISFQKNLTQAVHGIRDIKLLNKEITFLKYFSKDVIDLCRYLRKIKTIQEVPRFQLELFATILLNIVIFINFFSTSSEKQTLLILGMFGIAAFRILPSLNRIIQSVNSIRATYSVIDLLNENFKLSEHVNTYEINKNVKETINQIELKNVSFKYNNEQNKILNNINLKLKKGDLIGIFGPSGSGKTTLVDVITNLIKPDEGEILINNFKINNEKNFQNSIGYIPQFIYILNDTLKANIAFRENDQTIDDNKIETVVKQAMLLDLVKRLPNGINTEIDEMGHNLSGGQIQRIGISRVLYEDPSVIIFDEATNSLDQHAEGEILKIINEIKSEKIIIFISHKLELLKNNFQDIYELREGSLHKKD